MIYININFNFNSILFHNFYSNIYSFNNYILLKIINPIENILHNSILIFQIFYKLKNNSGDIYKF